MKPFMLIAIAFSILTVACKKAELVQDDIEIQKQIQSVGYEVISTIKGNTIYRIPCGGGYSVYLTMKDSDSTVASMVIH